METEDVQFRIKQEEEKTLAAAKAADKGWNPGLHDTVFFYVSDSGEFFCDEADGMVICTVSVVNYDERFPVTGLFVVDPAYKGPGIGMQINRYATCHAGSRIVDCDGVVVMVNQYQRDSGLYRLNINARYEGRGGRIMPSGLMVIRNVRFSDLVGYAAIHSPSRRERFLRYWIAEEGHFRLARLNDDGSILGYGVRRTCHTGYSRAALCPRLCCCGTHP